MLIRVLVSSLCALATGLALAACSEEICVPGDTQACVCAGGVPGGQTCRDDRSGWEPCQCGVTDADADADADADSDGDTDETGDADADGDGATQVECSDDIHPVEGAAKVLLTYVGLAPEWEIELIGPSHVVAQPSIGCVFTVEPGHYVVQVNAGATIELSEEIDLPSGELSLLAVTGGEAIPGALVFALDVSAPPVGRWRDIFVNLAQDSVDSTLDVYAYPPGVISVADAVPGSQTRIIEAMAYGELEVVDVPAHSLFYDYHPTGATPDELTWYEALRWDCAAPAFVQIGVINCDTFELEADGLCSASMGASWNAYSVEGEPCF